MMTYREAIEVLDSVIPEPLNKMVDQEHLQIALAWKMLREKMLAVLANEACGGDKYLKKEAVMEILRDGKNFPYASVTTQRCVMERVGSIPVANVNAAKVGHWIGEGDGYADGAMVYDVWHCSECDFCIDDGTDDPDLLPQYCEGCGAFMKGERT